MYNTLTDYDYEQLEENPFYDPFADVVNNYLAEAEPMDLEQIDPDYWLHRAQEAQEARMLQRESNS